MNTKKTCVSLLLAAAFALCLGGSGKAQDSVPKMQVFGGYSYGTNSCFGECFFDPGLHGYTAAATYNFNRHIGLEANFSGHNGSATLDHELPTSSENGFLDTVNENIYVYTFGPRLSLPVGNFSLFTHFLVGGTHVDENGKDQCLLATDGESSCGTTSTGKAHGDGFATKLGGGVDWNHRRWGIRILEVDYIHGQIFTTETCNNCSTESFDSSGNAFEMSAGLTFNFGGMR